MKKVVIIALICFCLLFSACGEESPKYGEVLEDLGENYTLLTGFYEDYPQNTDEYLRESYGLTKLSEQKAWFGENNTIQIDFSFENVKKEDEWQLQSAEKYAIDIFWDRSFKRWFKSEYDDWIVENISYGKGSIDRVICRVFSGGKLKRIVIFPDDVEKAIEEGTYS